MRNYKDSDYALNKFSEGIVYKFSDGIVEVTLEAYLKCNPGKTEADFMELKALSDEIYHQQDLADTRHRKRERVLKEGEDIELLPTDTLEDLLIEKQEKGYVMEAVKLLLQSGDLTEVQQHRFICHFFKGQSYRQIAKKENVHFTSVQESIEVSMVKLKKYIKF